MRKKRIGLITILKTNNYGADLQAFALHKKLNELGYDSEIINYLYYKNYRHIPNKNSKPINVPSKKQALKDFILYQIAGLLLEKVLPIFNSEHKNRLKRFNSFISNSKLSKEFRSINSLYKSEHNYDVFIVGSDQVWNPKTGSSIDPYFLKFAPKDKIKISFASSFGVDEINIKNHEFYKEALTNLDKISVRESQGVELVSSLSGKYAVQVLDPTLLLTKSEWISFESELPSLKHNSFILIYQLSDSEKIIEIAYKLKEKTGLPIIRICKRAFKIKKDKDIENIADAGPSEFLHLFSKAKFVLTNSFHGTAFSVNFNIPFFTFLNKEKSNNSRMISFLNKINLEKRIIWEDNNDNPDIEDGLEFENANKVLEEERKLSINYLREINTL